MLTCRSGLTIKDENQYRRNHQSGNDDLVLQLHLNLPFNYALKFSEGPPIYVKHVTKNIAKNQREIDPYPPEKSQTHYVKREPHTPDKQIENRADQTKSP